jgi:hypothetical protein
LLLGGAVIGLRFGEQVLDLAVVALEELGDIRHGDLLTFSRFELLSRFPVRST